MTPELRKVLTAQLPPEKHLYLRLQQEAARHVLTKKG